MPSRSPTIADWLSLLILTLVWGTAFLFTELALESLPAPVLVFGRLGIAALALLALLRASGLSLPRPGRAWGPVLVMAVFGNAIPFHLIAWGQQHIDSSLAGVLMAVMPLCVLTLSHFLIPNAGLTRQRVAGCAAGFAGVVIVIGPDLASGLRGNTALWGAAAVLGAALSYSASSVYARLIGIENPLRMSVAMLLAASLLTLPLAGLEVPDLGVPSAAAIGSLAVLGLLSTGLATVLYFRIVQGPGPEFLSLISYLVPAWAVIAGAIFLDESLSVQVYLGLALILAGIGLSEMRSRQAARPRHAAYGQPLKEDV